MWKGEVRSCNRTWLGVIARPDPLLCTAALAPHPTAQLIRCPVSSWLMTRDSRAFLIDRLPWSKRFPSLSGFFTAGHHPSKHGVDPINLGSSILEAGAARVDHLTKSELKSPKLRAVQVPWRPRPRRFPASDRSAFNVARALELRIRRYRVSNRNSAASPLGNSE